MSKRAAITWVVVLPLSAALLHCVGDDPTTGAPLADGGNPEAATPPGQDGAPPSTDGGGGTEAGVDAGPPTPIGKLTWGADFATSGSAFAVAMDASGASFVATTFSGTGVKFGATTLDSAGGADIALVKLSATGMVLWAKRIGGTGDELPGGLAVDPAGNVYLSGQFTSASLDAAGKAIAHGASAGKTDSFFAKFDGSGAPIWGVDLASSNGASDAVKCGKLAMRDAASVAFACDVRGTVTYAKGTSTGTDTSTIDTGALYGVADPASGKVVWTALLQPASATASPQNVNTTGVDLDAQGNLYVSGNTHANVLAEGNTIINGSSRMGSDENGYVAKLAAGSGGVSWVRVFGPSDNGAGFAVAQGMHFDPTGPFVYCGGNFVRADFGKGIVTSAGGGNNDDAFVLQLDTTGTTVWQKIIGNDVSADEVNDVAVDAWGSPIITGTVTAGGVTVDGKALSSGSGFFVIKLDPKIGTALWAVGRTSGGSVHTNALAVAPDGTSTAVGSFSGTLDLATTVTAAAPYDTFAAGLTP